MSLNTLDRPARDTDSGASFRTKSSFASLLDGLVQDVKTLLVQELRLAKHEIQQELGKAKTAALSLGVGLGLAVIGGLLLVLMLVHLLQALTGLPLWACYGIIGGLFILSGVILLSKARGTAADIHVVPPKTVQSMKENALWIKEQTQSRKI